MIQIVNEVDIPFNVRVVMPGEFYGRDDCVRHDDEFGYGPLIEFYDARHVKGFTDRGQFVSRYYLSTLIDGHAPRAGLLMDGANYPTWTLTAQNVREACAYAEGFIEFRQWQASQTV